MAHWSFSLQAQGCRGCVDAPVSVEEGIEAKAVAPAAGEVGDVHIGVADRLALAPHQQGFLSRQPRRTGPELLLAEQGRVVNVLGGRKVSAPAGCSQGEALKPGQGLY